MADLADPRVLFAAERTLMAWQRSSIALMGFGFVVERYGLFLHLLACYLRVRCTGVLRCGWVSFCC